MHNQPFKGPKFWGTATVGTKGQVVIPSKAREQFNIKEGDQLIVVTPPGGRAIGLLKADALENMLSNMQTEIGAALDSLNKNKKGKKQ